MSLKKAIRIFITCITIICFIVIAILFITTGYVILDYPVTFQSFSQIVISLQGVDCFPLTIKHLKVDIPTYGVSLNAQHVTFHKLSWKWQNCSIGIQKVQGTVTIPQREPSETTQKDSEIKLPNLKVEPYLPEHLEIENYSLKVHQKEDEFYIENLKLLISRKPTPQITVVGSETKLALVNYGQPKEQVGNIYIQWTLNNKQWEIQITAQFPSQLDCVGRIIFIHDVGTYKITLDNLKLSIKEDLSRWLAQGISSMSPQPVNFKTLHCANLSTSILWSNRIFIPEKIQGEVLVETLEVGSPKNPMWQGSLSLTGNSEFIAETETYNTVIQSTSPIETQLQFGYTPKNGNIQGKFKLLKPISSNQLFRFAPLMGKQSLSKSLPPFTCSLNSEWRGNLNEAINLIFDGSINIEPHQSILIHTQLELLRVLNKFKWFAQGYADISSHKVSFQIQRDPQQHISCSLKAHQFPLSVVNNYVSTEMVQKFSNSIAQMEINAHSKTPEEIQIELQCQLDPSQEDNEVPPLFPAKYSATLSVKDWNFITGTLQWDSENALSLKLDSIQIKLNPFQFRGNFISTVYLSSIHESLLNIPLRGKLNLDGSIGLDEPDKLKVKLNTKGEGFGYSRYTIPEKWVIGIQSESEYQFTTNRLLLNSANIGWSDLYPIHIQKGEIYFSPKDGFSANVEQIHIRDDGKEVISLINGNTEQDKIRFLIKHLIYENSTIKQGQVETDIQLSQFNFPSWGIQGQGWIIQGSSDDITTTGIPLSLALRNINMKSLKLKEVEGNILVKIYPWQVIWELSKGIIWDGSIAMKGNVSNQNATDSTYLCHFEAQFQNVDLERFTEEIQPPWVRLSGKSKGELAGSINIFTGELVEGDASLVCPEGLTLNRDILLKLIAYMQNVTIVKKQLDKIIGNEDPKSFQLGELTAGFKNNQLTISLFLSTPKLDLAPIFYINTDWWTIWSLIAMPSNAQITIQY